METRKKYHHYENQSIQLSLLAQAQRLYILGYRCRIDSGATFRWNCLRSVIK